MSKNGMICLTAKTRASNSGSPVYRETAITAEKLYLPCANAILDSEAAKYVDIS